MREDLVNTAVHFLRNQKVQSSPLQQRLHFLEKKGLDQEEINEALNRSGMKEENNMIFQKPIHAISRWERTSQMMSTIIILGGAVYFANKIFRRYISPWLGWSKSGPSLEEALISVANSNERILREVQLMIDKITDMQKNMNDNYSVLIAHILKHEKDENILELKNEMKSVKALLLRKDQFPPPPVLNPVIPAWQLEKKSITALNDNKIDMQQNFDLIKNQKLENQNINHSNKNVYNNITLTNNQKYDLDLKINDKVECSIDNVVLTKNGLKNDFLSENSYLNGGQKLNDDSQFDISLNDS